MAQYVVCPQKKIISRIFKISGALIVSTELEIKIKKCAKETTLFNRLHKHSFGGLGADTLTFLRVDSFFWGGGLLSAFSKTKLRFQVFFVEPPVYDMRILYLLNNVNLGLDSYSLCKNTRALLLNRRPSFSVSSF